MQGRAFGGMSAANRAGVYDGKIAGLYDLEETLGSGHFAVVKLARHVFTGEKVAVKVIEKTKLDEISRAHLFQEVRCMKLVQHPHVVRLYEVIDTQTKLYLILELGDGGDLYDYIMRHDKGLSEHVAQEYFRQIVRAISYCHQLHVVHRDLKPENVVFFEKLGVVKLTDFGFSNKFCPGQKLETSCGSLAYSAPEILLGDSYDAPAVDVWSLGVILFMLVCGHPPFQEANDSETLTMIMDCKYTMPDHVSEGCRRLISTMLVREPENRATLQQIAQDPWLLEGSTEEIPEYLPLVSREQVSEEDHALILQKMVNGKIATKEEILEALDRNEYNHITATYFLLAERKLRAHRQEEAQKRKPELTLPVSSSARLQNFRKDSEDDPTKEDSLLPPKLGMLLSVPRTPGTEMGQGRNRKCSIVQEEEDDEDDVTGAGHEELSSTPLNRRGSRSEGRINVTVQDRIAESERLKQEAASKKQAAEAAAVAAAKEKEQEQLKEAAKENSMLGGFGGGIGNVTLITSENSCTKDRLGIAGGGLHRKVVPEIKRVGGLDFGKKSSSILKPSLGKIGDSNVRGGSFDKCIASIRDVELVHTKIITDSSTITIPLPSVNVVTTSTIPKYKTMPSPTRTNTILNANTNCLNEIFEEGTDVGSSDSTSTTPRPAVRNQFNVRQQTAGNAAGSNNVHRRTKFNKSRTASCSSSDASDDDSENRKKRAHKIVDSTVKPQTQRRDSHDDSSDSQDPGNAAAPSGTGACVRAIMTSTANGSTTTSSTQSPPNQSDKNSGNGNGSTHRKSSQQVDFRRHRGRRRPVETRLRESQSLNRITEVQESEISHSAAIAAAAAAAAATGAIAPNNVPNGDDDCPFEDAAAPGANPEDEAAAAADSKPAECEAANPTSNGGNATAGGGGGGSKPKGFKARFFNKFQSNPSSNSSTPSADGQQLEGGAENGAAGNDIEIMVELKKAYASSESNSKSTKKIKILGRYFQVHKKFYVPLSGLFQRGRLYKAQSCGSIVRDKVNVNPNGSGTTTRAHSNARHSTIFNEKNNRFIKNCLSGSRLLGSDGDINHNGNSFITLPPAGAGAAAATTMTNGSVSPVEHQVTASAAAAASPCGLLAAGTGAAASVPIKTA